MKPDKGTIIIDLDDSMYAHAFDRDNRIHEEEFERAKEIVKSHFTRIKESKRSKLEGRQHNTISIFGERGSGKTSFIRSLLKDIEEQKDPDLKDIETLGLVDPTIIEEKVHIFLLVISLINEKVETVLNKKDTTAGGEGYALRREWRKFLGNLSKGLPSLKPIGKDYRNESWEDDEFIMDQGLEKIHKAYRLEDNFHRLVDKALNIINKNAFIIAFDDTDTNLEKGWRVLETIRKYLTTPKIIVLLSGNLNLYNLIVREMQWEQLTPRILEKEKDRDYKAMVSQLENHYMLKVLKATNRIHLHSLSTAMNMYGGRYEIKHRAGAEPREIKSVYADILASYGFRKGPSQRQLIDFLLGLSIRSQISFLKANIAPDHTSINAEKIATFLSALYAEQIEIDYLLAQPKNLCIGILNYLLRIDKIRDSYLLLPNTESADSNSSLTALSIIFTNSQIKNRHLSIEYLLRVGYLRNVLLSDTSNKTAEHLIPYAGYNQDISLRNMIGRSMAYELGLGESETKGLNAHISLFGLAQRSKKAQGSGNSIDNLLKEGSNAVKVLGYMPLCSLRYTKKNESRLYYSLFEILAVIANVIRQSSNVEVTNLAQILKDQAQLRDYAIPNESADENIEFDNTVDLDLKDDEADTSLDALVSRVEDWLNETSDIMMPPYVLARIATRAYAALSKTKGDTLADHMQLDVAAFLNSCLIEEYKEMYSENKGWLKIGTIKFANVETDLQVFEQNITALKRNGKLQDLPFTYWMLRCPLLYCFFSKDAMKRILADIINLNDDILNASVYESLGVKTKETPKKTSKYSFGSTDRNFKVTYKILEDNKFDMDILKGTDSEKIKEAIIATGLFANNAANTKRLQNFINKVKDNGLYPFNKEENAQE